MERKPCNQYRFCSCFNCDVNHEEEFEEPRLITVNGYKICKPVTQMDATHYLYKPWKHRIYILDRINLNTGLTLIQTRLQGRTSAEVEKRLVPFASWILSYYQRRTMRAGINYSI